MIVNNLITNVTECVYNIIERNHNVNNFNGDFL